MFPYQMIGVALLILLAACTPQQAQAGAYSGTLVLEGEHVYPGGTILPGALVVLGGQARVAEGARVDGPVFLLGGALIVDGSVGGDISVIGGRLALGPQARIGGDVRVTSGQAAELAPGAVVAGQVLRGPASGLEPGDLFPRRSLRDQLPRMLVEALLLAGLAYLLARFVPGAVARVRRAALRYWLVSAAMGLLGGVVGLVLLVVMAFTLILIPVTLLGFVVGFLALGYGYIGIGSGLGRWGAARWRPGWSRALAACLGTFAFVLGIDLLSLLPALGGAIGILAALVSLGAVLLTRFGLREFVPAFGWEEESRE